MYCVNQILQKLISIIIVVAVHCILPTERATGKRRFLPLLDPPVDSHDDVGVLLIVLLILDTSAIVSSRCTTRLVKEDIEPWIFFISEVITDCICAKRACISTWETLGGFIGIIYSPRCQVLAVGGGGGLSSKKSSVPVIFSWFEDARP